MPTETKLTLQTITRKIKNYEKFICISLPGDYSYFMLYAQTNENCERYKKIETNKAGFIGQPLKSLLIQISPKIKFVYGNPENRYRRSIGDTYLKFHFFDKKEAQKLFSTNHTPTGLIVELVSDENNHHKPLPKGGLNEWTKENTKEYGDMIIQNIRVVGEN